MQRSAILLMAYGSPSSLAEVEPYFTHIRGGRRPSPDHLHEITERYHRIGGRSPLLDITRRVARSLQADLDRSGNPDRFTVYLGMKHSAPFIADVVLQIVADGLDEIIALPLAPHYSRMSVGAYHKAVAEAMGVSNPLIRLRPVYHWGAHPRFVQLVASRVEDALGGWPDERTQVIFTAHSLPERLRREGDPYEAELMESADLVAGAVGLRRWSFAFQSASPTGEPWLGPDHQDVIRELAASGEVDRVLVCPVGFVADHLEVLYDLDVETRALAEELGLEFRRTRSLNDDSRFVQVLSEVVREMAVMPLAGVG
ncbi:MAG: ferrochelatase [Chloroflexi bacterium]|nr:ferrochelatase [Chloroflexota bacterium]